MKRGLKHNSVYCQHKQDCLLDQCSYLILSVPSYTFGYCYAFWHLWYCWEEARAFVFKYQMLQRAELNQKWRRSCLRKLFPGQKNMAEGETFQHLRPQKAEAVLHRDSQKAIREIPDWQDTWQEISWAVMNQHMSWPAAFSPRQPREPPQPRESPCCMTALAKIWTHKSNFKCFLVLQEHPLSLSPACGKCWFQGSGCPVAEN